MNITVLTTGSTLVSSAVPDRLTHRWRYAYTDLFQNRHERISVPVKAFLIEVDHHRILVDTGWSKECIDHPIKHLGLGLWFASEPVLTTEQTVCAQLNAMGIRPEDLDAILLTHLDCDHVSGLRDLFGAKHVYCSVQEYEYANHITDMRYRKGLWAHTPLKPITMDTDPSAPFCYSKDLFGDGRVRLVLTSGHTIGSMAVLVRGSTGFAAFIGDDSYNRNSWEKIRLPGPLYSASDMTKTLHWVQQLSHNPDCIGIYAAHDPDGPLGGKDL